MSYPTNFLCFVTNSHCLVLTCTLLYTAHTFTKAIRGPYLLSTPGMIDKTFTATCRLFSHTDCVCLCVCLSVHVRICVLVCICSRCVCVFLSATAGKKLCILLLSFSENKCMFQEHLRNCADGLKVYVSEVCVYTWF